MSGDTQRDALERRRVREGLPEGGTWDFNLAHDEWMYQWREENGDICVWMRNKKVEK